MAKIDVYLRSIERFGAAGAVLTSGQAVTLRFPTGDRNATQVTQHDQLIAIVREVASPPALALIDSQRPAKFEIESAGTRYTLSVTPKPGVWQVLIEGPATAAAPTPAAAVAQPTTQVPRQQPRAATAPTVADSGAEMAIERGQYAEAPARPTSGSALLDQWTNAARAVRATDVYLATGAPPAARVAGDLQALGERAPLDAETISRELGVIAPAAARAAWTERGVATFTYGDGAGRVRATLTRDHRGTSATLRLLVAEPPALERLGLGRDVGAWLAGPGLVLVAGASGSGKTTTLAALVRALGELRKRVVTFEDPIEIMHVTSPWVSQRALREHVPDVAAGVHAAMQEGVDAIVVGGVSSSDAAVAVVDAVAAGHLVLAAIAAGTARAATDRLLDLLPPERRELARSVLESGLIGTIAPVVKGAARSFEVVTRRSG
jgi:twitching motility protein PilT